MDDVYLQHETREVQRGRYNTMKRTLAPLGPMIQGKRVMDFGCGWGLSVFALLALGAREVVGVEPDTERVEEGNALLRETGESGYLVHVEDTRYLPFGDGEFDAVVANGVFEHIPQPRDEFIREMWRIAGEKLIVSETPNKYFPIDRHTTGLWFVHWLPKLLACRYAEFRGKRPKDDWDTCGWRGLGHWELARHVPGGRYVPETGRSRHKLLTAFGLPSSLLDPWPLWVFERG